MDKSQAFSLSMIITVLMVLSFFVGYKIGYDEYYEKGYDEGYLDGYSDGFFEGVEVQLNPVPEDIKRISDLFNNGSGIEFKEEK